MPKGVYDRKGKLGNRTDTGVNISIRDNHDSWKLNTESRKDINVSLRYYHHPDNHERMKERCRLYWKGKEKEKKEYDRRYYNWRKSWGDYQNYNNRECYWNLLLIQGDIFSAVNFKD